MLRSLARAVVLLTMLAAVAACSGHAGTYCEGWSECVGGNDQDTDACIAKYDGDGEYAAAYDCDKQWAAYVECAAEYGSCDTDGNEPRYRLSDACDSEEDKLEACIRNASDVR